MNDEELRALVRSAIARQLGAPPAEPTHMPAMMPRHHPSHGLLTLADGSEMDGRCVIETAVMCNHCGYCKSMGH